MSRLRLSPGPKLIAKQFRPPLAMPIKAATLLLDILFDFSSHDRRKVRRSKNTFDDICRWARSLVTVEHAPGGASAYPQDNCLLGDRIKPTGD